MARLILLNGLPSSGKSTIAKRYVDDHVLSLLLDIDVVRGMLGQWSEHAAEAGLAARAIALEMACVQLTSGHDVVVPQFLGRIDFVFQLEQLAAEVDVQFVELELRSSSTEEAAARFQRRSASSESQEHRDAVTGLSERGSLEEFEEMSMQLANVVSQRPATRIVESIDGDIDGTYRCLNEALAT